MRFDVIQTGVFGVLAAKSDVGKPICSERQNVISFRKDRDVFADAEWKLVVIIRVRPIQPTKLLTCIRRPSFVGFL